MSILASALAPPTADEFAVWHVAVWGRAPMAWQDDLAERVCTTDTWPPLLDVPQPVGVLDVALYWQALDADRPERRRRAPGRIVWLTERPEVARAHVTAIQQALRTDRDPILRRVGLRLAHRGRSQVRIASVEGVGPLDRDMLLLLDGRPMACALLPSLSE